LPEEGTHLRNLFNHALSVNSLKPSVYAEANDAYVSLQLALSREYAASLPRSRVANPKLENHSFPEPCYFYIVAACRKHQHLPPIQEAIREMGNCCKKSGQIRSNLQKKL